MKIAFFTPNLNLGGYERVALTYANELAARGDNSVCLVCGTAEGELRAQIGGAVEVVELHAGARKLLPKLTRLFAKREIDVFYVGFRLYGAIAILAKMLSRNRQIKLCYSQHGYESGGRVVRFLLGRLLDRCDLFVAVTPHLLEYERRELSLYCPSRVAGNPVISGDTPTFEGDLFDGDAPVVVTCGRLSEDKNYALAVRIVDRLNRSGHKVNLLMLGSGPKEESLRALVAKLGLTDRVRMVGYTENPVGYMRKCDVYLHTCRREGFGNTVVEAMCAGLPVVTTACGGPQTLIEGDVYGVCFGDADSPDAVERGADAVLYALENRASYTRQRERAMQFESESASVRLLEIFEEIADE